MLSGRPFGLARGTVFDAGFIGKVDLPLLRAGLHETLLLFLAPLLLFIGLDGKDRNDDPRADDHNAYDDDRSDERRIVILLHRRAAPHRSLLFGERESEFTERKFSPRESVSPLAFFKIQGAVGKVERRIDIDGEFPEIRPFLRGRKQKCIACEYSL